ncbi:MAG TPA: acetyl-CoA C-acetyltransferase [Kofleriaceae bacterium]|jgi:acetyl-CoA C-acetyltransferase|nr:acetyl-CoA C-acetyltransferase [Kofleriaceae bacterium]
MLHDSFVLDAVRTPRGKGKNGALHGVHPQELLAQTLEALSRRNALDPRDVDDVVIGAVSQVGEQGANIARNAVLAAGWPDAVSAVSINRFCASGLQAIHFAAMGVASGAQDLVIAGGVESMSRVAIGSDGAGQDGNNHQLRRRVFQVPQGISADLIATRERLSRDALDRYALGSQQRAAAAQRDGAFARSLVHVRDPESGRVLLEVDEHVRPSTTLAGLAALPPSFAAAGQTAATPAGDTLDQIALRAYPEVAAIDHRHTAGNSSGIVDGAAAVAVASARYVERHGLTPRARIRALAQVGSEPVIMLTGPTPAARKALALAGLTPGDIDLWEINEAFAAVVLQTIRALEIDPERVNVNGGAIALGHPLGATGAMLLGTALDELERRDRQFALITLCIGGGQGIATVIERLR